MYTNLFSVVKTQKNDTVWAFDNIHKVAHFSD